MRGKGAYVCVREGIEQKQESTQERVRDCEREREGGRELLQLFSKVNSIYIGEGKSSRHRGNKEHQG